MCTYELKNPSLCSECGGKLSLVKEKKKAVTTFESNITRIVSYKETPKSTSTQQDNTSNIITQKDFYNANKDRYVDASWKDKLNTDNNSLTTSNNTVTNTPSTISTLPTNKMDLYSYEKIISTEKNDPIWSICYCPTLLQGKGAIVTGHSSGSIFAWNCDKYIKSKTYLEHSNKVYDIKNIYYTSTYRQIFVSVSEDRSLKIWESTSQHSTISIASIFNFPFERCAIINDNIPEPQPISSKVPSFLGIAAHAPSRTPSVPTFIAEFRSSIVKYLNLNIAISMVEHKCKFTLFFNLRHNNNIFWHNYCTI
jgi:hypothetical protein